MSKTIDITPTWEAVLPVYIAAVKEDSIPAQQELPRMAKLADAYVAAQKQQAKRDEHTEAAMCLWEAMLEAHMENSLPPYILKMWEDEGAFTVRSWTNTVLTPKLQECYEYAVGLDYELDYEGCFDWHFVPRFLEKYTEGCDLKSLARLIVA